MVTITKKRNLFNNLNYISISTSDPEEVPPKVAWEVEAALRKIKNGKEAGKDEVNIETLKAGDETIAKQLAKLYTKCITERRVPKTWTTSVAFVDYEKAFDSVQTQAILSSLQAQGIEDVYIEILKDIYIYTDSSVTVHLHKESEKIRIKRGVRQGDTISPKLFTATLESIFRRLN